MIPCKTKLKTFITFLKFKRASSQNLNLVQLLDFLETVEDRFLEIHGVLVSELKAKIHDHFKITEIANNKAAFNACLAKCLNRFLVGALSVIVKLQTSRRFVSSSSSIGYDAMRPRWGVEISALWANHLMVLQRYFFIQKNICNYHSFLTTKMVLTSKWGRICGWQAFITELFWT